MSLVGSESAPSRTLPRRKLVRNRITIDTDLIFHGNNNNSTDPETTHHSSYPSMSQHALPRTQKPQGEDTDRWVEEQFDLGCYEDQGMVKETDILSDDDEYCNVCRTADLEGKMERLELQGGEMTSHNLNGRLETGSEVMLSVMQEEEVERIKLLGRLFSSCGVSISRCSTPGLTLAPLKQCSVEGASNKDHDVIWVRRDDFGNGCNGDVF
ncbi:hypothetical protein F7725_006624 [Dissostichus mawsoni]|uniref:Uncharacterized protein n=1 Tax=Dissostichus mawsoni TaxID=36200 RepID=A0A7J5XUH8_DISMA|nr:hypothetical protein F7725_006624 [Dissostichus mawsoni]